MPYSFYMDPRFGLLRQMETDNELYPPEMWTPDGWISGGDVIWTAIRGREVGDPYTAGKETADLISLERAMTYAAANKVDLFADRIDDQTPEYSIVTGER